jgi:hypothetical protein
MAGSTQVTGQGLARPAKTIGLDDRAKVGSGLAIHLSEPASVADPGGAGIGPSTAQWKIEVYAEFGEGEFLTGIITTTSIAAGARPARTVGLAYIPGAKTWRVVVFGSAGATCNVRLSSDECCYGGVFGLVPVNDAVVLDVKVQPAAINVPQGVLSQGPSTLLVLRAIVDAAVGPAWLGPVDKAAPIVNGDPWADVPIQIEAGGNGNVRNFLRSYREGLPFQFQIRWAISTTLANVTLGPNASVGGETS